VRTLKITFLSIILVGEVSGLDEWGFSALVQADGYRILINAGAHLQTVPNNARSLQITSSACSK
jgi:metal-dependent hydrolase (beta-lactamase superfamily II)